MMNWIWKIFILIHEYKNIFYKRKLFKSVSLTSEQKKQIDSFYKKNYGKTIPYWWHQLYMSYTGKFDFQYIPEYIFSTKLELLQNRRIDVLPFENKNMLSVIFGGGEKCFVRQPETLLMRVKGRYFDESRSIISEQNAVKKITYCEGGNFVAFIKVTVDTSSGCGVRMLDMNTGIDQIENEEIQTIFNKMGKNFVVQKCISPHPIFATLYPKAINTLRVVTYMTHDKIKVAPITLRIGQGGSVVDNAHAGGIFIGVSEEGKLLKEAFTEYQKRYTVHPDTGVVFEGYQIPCVPQIRQVAIKLHEQVPMLQFVSWDFTVDKDGEVVLIEANLHSQAVWLAQMAHGRAMFGEDTAEMLQMV